VKNEKRQKRFFDLEMGLEMLDQQQVRENQCEKKPKKLETSCCGDKVDSLQCFPYFSHARISGDGLVYFIFIRPVDWLFVLRNRILDYGFY